MPYHLIALIAALLLGFRYAAVAEASLRSKLLVGAVIVLSLIVWLWYPRWFVGAMLLQVAVSIYVLLYFRLKG